MTPRQLEYFLAVADEGGFTRAAERLHVSQTAVTKQVQLLERELGCALFDRSTKTTSLTEEGRFFVGQARGALASFDKAEDNMRAYLAGERGTLRIGFITYMDSELLVRLFTTYTSRYPLVTVSAVSSSSRNLADMVREGRIDAYIGVGTVWNEGLRRLRLGSYPIVAMVPRTSELAGRDGVTKGELGRVLFDTREMKSGRVDSQPLEGYLLEVACGLGSVIVHSFTKANAFDQYTVVVPLVPAETDEVCLMADPTRVSPLVDGLFQLATELVGDAEPADY